MVSSNYLSTDARRYPSRVMAPYSPPYPDRRDSYATHEARNTTMSERDTVDESPAQRKRIAVACGRCRKRKIRCSGDNGSGQPCTNCKNAGHEPCQFLRVASQEAPMKGDGLPYGVDLARHYQSRPSAMTSLLPTIHPYMDGVTSQADMAYRPGPTSYPYNGGKGQYYSGQGFPPNSYPEESCSEYPVYPPYQAVQDPSYMMGAYRSMAPGLSTVKAGGHLYVETDPGYGFSSGPGPAVAHRPTPSGDSSSYSFPSVDDGSGSLSGGSSSNDRMTPPNSMSRRALPGHQQQQQQQQHQQHLGRNDSLSPSYSKHAHSSTADVSPASPPASPPAGFGSFESAAVPGYPMGSSMRSHSDMYTTSPDGLPGSPHRVGPELTYRYTDTTRPVGSESVNAGYMSQGGPHHHHHHGHSHGHGHHGGYMVGHADGLEAERKPARPALRA
ncbi:hypothetical protein S40288_01316 [Stachybotrys chartarum IBT 40288]|nr:hypothetical protein S40288_01316 [Stachybotrys chartarum IBT 40288]